MYYLNLFKTTYTQILDVVFPINCLVCGKEGRFLCMGCGIKLPKLDFQKCLACKKPSPFGRTHPDCQTKLGLDGIISALPYSDLRIKKLIEMFKYKFVSDLSVPLSELVIESIANQALQNYLGQFELVPVPLHNRRFRWRGFNQSELLANGLAQILNAPINPNVIERKKFTKPQVGLNLAERQENIKGAFVARPNDGKYIVVDDVVTSGSTIKEITQTLKRSGATEVWALTLAAD